MNNCKYCKYEIVNEIEHYNCSNEELKKLNNSIEKDIPCMGSQCGKFEENNKNGEDDK